MGGRPTWNSSWPISSGCSGDDEVLAYPDVGCGSGGFRERPDPRDGGSCNAPLDYQLTIESGIVDGSAYDTTARGPVPNPNKSAPPPPGPGLWQIHGLARAGSFNLLSVASVRGTQHQRMQLTVRSEGGSLVVTERSGCRRTARLARG
jgi:hypothetical protein